MPSSISAMLTVNSPLRLMNSVSYTQLDVYKRQVWYLGQPLKGNHWAGFALIAVAAWLIFLD